MILSKEKTQRENSEYFSDTTSTADFTTLSPIPPESKEQYKIGSFQIFVKNKGSVENYSWDLFAVDEVHKIGILDLRILNLDRNNCNILVA